MDPVYSVPLIAPDLRQEENILQIGDVLQHLSNVANDVFQRLDKRIECNLSRVKSISERVGRCALVVDRLAGAECATRVRCCAKYPAGGDACTYSGVFHPEHGVVMRHSRPEGRPKPAVYTDQELQDKLEFYHVKLAPSGGHSLPPGRGGVPPELGCAGALLQRDSAEPAYWRAARSVPVAPGTGPRPPGGLHAAPATVTQRDSVPAQRDYLYSPHTGEVPSLDVPRDLPHLAGVAGDMRFLADSEPTIAPSGACASAPPQGAPQGAPPAAPPPPEPAAPREPTALREAPEVRPVSQPGAPPPPPPPPPPPMAAPDHSEPDSVKGQSAPPKKPEVPVQPPSLDSRASLMEAIRTAGGSGKARLRSTAATDTAEVAPKSSGGDLMADLHARLSMRRKGISGAAGGTILHAISALVPPPAPREPDTRSNSEMSSAEDDWD